MDANLLLWIGQALLALAFAGVGYGHAFRFASAGASQVLRLSPVQATRFC